MISIDAIIADFIGKNLMTIGMLLILLKGIADVSPWKWDEKIIAVIASMLEVFTGKTKTKGG